jgi:hypothetical protein
MGRVVGKAAQQAPVRRTQRMVWEGRKEAMQRVEPEANRASQQRHDRAAFNIDRIRDLPGKTDLRFVAPVSMSASDGTRRIGQANRSQQSVPMAKYRRTDRSAQHRCELRQQRHSNRPRHSPADPSSRRPGVSQTDPQSSASPLPGRPPNRFAPPRNPGKGRLERSGGACAGQSWSKKVCAQRNGHFADQPTVARRIGDPIARSEVFRIGQPCSTGTRAAAANAASAPGIAHAKTSNQTARQCGVAINTIDLGPSELP